MRVIIAGSRESTDYQDVVDAVEMADLLHGITPTVVLSGTARGVDRLGERYGAEYGLKIERFPAMWQRYPRTAGYMRNAQMAGKAEALIAIWDGVSPGTKHMIAAANERKLLIYVHQPRKSRPEAARLRQALGG